MIDEDFAGDQVRPGLYPVTAPNLDAKTRVSGLDDSGDRTDGRSFFMGFRRRTRRRALIAGAVAGGAIAHHERKKYAEEQAAYDEAPADDQAPPDDYQEQPQYAPPPADPADELEHLAQLHASGVLTDDEFTAAKAKILGT
jgi:hypothetical protein